MKSKAIWMWMGVFALTFVIGFAGLLSADETKPADPQSQVQKNEGQDSEAKTEEPDPERVLVSYGDEKLYAWQAEKMKEVGAARGDVNKAVDAWLEMRMKATEAKRRGLDQGRDNLFILDLYRDYYLGILLEKALKDEIVPVTEEEMKKQYEADHDRYNILPQATIRHITVQKRDRAEQIIKEIRNNKKTRSIDLYNQYVPEEQRDRHSGVIKGDAERIEKRLGKEAAEAVFKAEAGAVLGPFIGGDSMSTLKGFEIVILDATTPGRTHPFEDVKKSIENKMMKSRFEEIVKTMMERLKQEKKIVKSEELLPKKDKNATNEKPAEQKP